MTGGTAVTRKERPDGWWYPWIFVAAMGLVIVVNGIMVAFALSSWTGLESPDYYVRGLEYNENLAGARTQAKLGWKTTFAIKEVSAAGDTRNARISVVFTDHDGKPLNDLDVRTVILRPTSEGHDQQLALTAAGDGVYKAAVAFPLPGLWNVRIHAYRGDIVFQESHRVELP